MSAHCDVCQAPTAGGDLCADHRRQLGTWLHAVPTLVDELLTRRRGLTKGGSGAGSGERPIPWNEGAARVLADFEARVRMACQAAYWESASVAATRAHAAWRTFGGAGTYRQLSEAVSRAEDYLAPPARWYAGVCSAPVVGEDGVEGDCTRDLYARGTTGKVRCPACHARHDVAERRAVLLDRVDDQLVTLREFVGAAPNLLGADVRLDRVQAWAKRGRVASRGTRARTFTDPRTGTEHVRQVLVFRFGELRDLAPVTTREGRVLDMPSGLSIEFP